MNNSLMLALFAFLLVASIRNNQTLRLRLRVLDMAAGNHPLAWQAYNKYGYWEMWCAPWLLHKWTFALIA